MEIEQKKCIQIINISFEVYKLTILSLNEVFALYFTIQLKHIWYLHNKYNLGHNKPLRRCLTARKGDSP